MNILDIITKKKDKGTLTRDELEFAFMGYLENKIPNYQISALLMAIVLNGMDMSETLDLTDIFIKSGDQYNLSDKMPNVVDKHSTGGVGDSTTFVIGPMCACLGLHMAKMSGRGLGYTGGTIDKIESIPGFKVNPDKETFIKQVDELGFALSAQNDDLTPLDKVIYALRDVTGTTESIPLIASSIMSKKIALGADNILIDVKFGSGALMKTRDQAKELSRYLTTIGEAYEKNVKTIISPMSTPLSYAIGNALEVAEAINVLHGKECPLYHSCIDIVATLYSMARGVSIEEAKKEAKKVIITGDALKKFYEFVKAQGGRLGELAISENVIKVRAQKSGRIDTIDALGAAKLAAKLGASRMKLEDKIDYKVGIMLSVTEGDTVNKGDLLMNLYVKDYNQEFTENDFSFINIVDF